MRVTNGRLGVSSQRIARRRFAFPPPPFCWRRLHEHMKTFPRVPACLALALLAFLLACLAAAPSSAQTMPEVMPELPGTVQNSPEHDARMAWFREAKYGLFIHWGLYAIPAGVWKGQAVRPSSEWIMAHARIPVKEYESLAKEFNPVQFDAEHWVQMAQDAGMKYIVITAKHGDGFAMYHSATSPYSIFDATPFHRDPCKELADVCAKHAIRLGFYYSQSVDWHEPGGEGNNWDFDRDDAKNKSGAFDQFLQTKVEPQVRELLTGYGPVCELFFDTPAMITPARGQRIADAVRAAQPACLIDGRLGVPGDYATMGDNGIPAASVGSDWETPGELNHNWGFDQNDSDYKSPGQVLFNLLDVASKGGNYLLDVGPTALGVIPVVAEQNLLTVGRWLKVNGEALYGAKLSPFGEGFVGGGFGRKLLDGGASRSSCRSWTGAARRSLASCTSPFSTGPATASKSRRSGTRSKKCTC